MALFNRSKKLDGWLAIVPHSDGVIVTQIDHRASQPIVRIARKFDGVQIAAGQDKALEKVGRDVDAQKHAVTTLLGSRDYQFLSVDAPNVPQEELKAAMRWKLKDMLDYHIDDATIDILEVPVEKSAGARNRNLYAVAAKNQVIEQTQTVLLGAKLSLRAIDVPEMAQRNIAGLFEPEGRGIAMLSFGADGGLLTVTAGGELYLARRVDIGLADLGHSDDERRVNCYERITLEVQRSLDHFDRQFHYITLSGLRIAPLPEAARPLVEYMRSNLYMPIEQIDLATVLDLENVPILKSVEAQNEYFLSLGAALRWEEKAL